MTSCLSRTIRMKQNEGKHLSKWILFLSLHDVSGIDISDKYDSMSCLSCCFVTSSDESAKAGLPGQISLSYFFNITSLPA